MVAGVPADVATAVDAYLRAVDDAVPGLVEGLYVTGSVALRDYHAGISDIDLVAVSREALSPSTLDVVAAVHRTIGRRVDVVYATRDDLRRHPAELSLPCSLDGEFRPEGAFDANPVVWRVLSTRSITVRGTPLTRDDIWFDADVLRHWNLANLDGYWAEWVERARGQVGTEDRARSEYGLQWLALGVPRLHYTIATLDVVSKTAAGRYGIAVAPSQWHVVFDVAMALRADRHAWLPSPPDVLWRVAIDVSVWLIDDALSPVRRTCFASHRDRGLGFRSCVLWCSGQGSVASN